MPDPSNREAIEKTLENLNAKAMKEKTWEAKCQLLRQILGAVDRSIGTKATVGGLKDLWLVQLMDAAETAYLINRSDHMVLEADNNVLTTIEKKLEYKVKALVKFEGRRWRLGDFLLRVESVTQTTTQGVAFLGHVIEVEYTPLVHMEVASTLLSEFVLLLSSGLPDEMRCNENTGFDVVAAPFAAYKHLSGAYSYQHTAVAYADVAVLILATAHQRGELEFKRG